MTTTHYPVERMTERMLREEVEQLQRLANDGDITLVQANRLAEMKDALHRIAFVKGKTAI